MTTRPCPACEETTATCRGTANGYPLLKCCYCYTVYTADLAVDDPEGEYEQYYSDENLTAPSFIGKSLDRTIGSFDAYRRSNRLLDVGFGGSFAMEAAARAGWDCDGVEVSKPAVEHAHSLGLNAFHGELQDADFGDGTFDVVVMSEVLEHVTDPRGLLAEVRRVLRPGGLMWLTTPNCSGLSARLLRLRWTVLAPPEHLHLFSRRGLLHLLESTGFSPTRMVTENFNPLEVVNALKARGASSPHGGGDFDRVRAGYSVLEQVYSRPALGFAKRRFDEMLHVSRLGDTIRVWATTAA